MKTKAKARRRVTAPPNAHTMLRVLDEFFCTAARVERQMLWNVLTALRGPDVALHIKRRTTCHVRSAALPRTLKSGMAPAMFYALNGAASRANVPDHFVQHITDAVSALRCMRRKINVTWAV